MTAIAETVTALKRHMADNWAATPVAWPNVEFDPDRPGAGWPPGGAYVFFDVMLDGSRSAGFGDPDGSRVRVTGAIRADVYVAAGSGDDQALTLAAQLAGLLGSQRIGGALCHAAAIGRGAQDPRRGRWWRRRVTVPFSFTYLA